MALGKRLYCSRRGSIGNCDTSMTWPIIAAAAGLWTLQTHRPFVVFVQEIQEELGNPINGAMIQRSVTVSNGLTGPLATDVVNTVIPRTLL